MKKIFSILSLVALALTGCLKDTAPNDFKSVQPILEMQLHGLATFSSDAIVAAGKTDPIVTPIVINVASIYPLGTDVSYTLGIDDSKRTAYNTANPLPAPQYNLLPDSCFTFTKRTGTIKAGTRLDTTYVTFYPNKIDPSKNYMLVVRMTAAVGITVSGDYSTAYLHIIGNPLAGKYSWDYFRWQGADTTIPAPQGFTGATTVILPVTSTAILTPESYTQTFINPTGGITVNFDNTAGVLSNFTASFDATTAAGVPAGGFLLLDGPKIVNVTVVGTQATNYTGTRIRTFVQYQNSTGGIRSLVDQFVKLP